MIEVIRSRIGELVETLAVLDDRLAADDTEQLPGLVVCRLGVAVDEAAATLARHAEALASVGRQR
jgi:hypothetical protein